MIDLDLEVGGTKWLRSSSGPKQIKNHHDYFYALWPVWPWVLSYVNRIAVGWSWNDLSNNDYKNLIT